MVLIFLAACGSDSGSAAGAAVFAENDSQCASPTLTNDNGDDELLETAIECLFTELDAGNPVTVDMSIPTVEGDPIFHRYEFDGTDVLTIVDNRLDEFGEGVVIAERCTSLVRGQWLPQGTNCEPVDHPGFANPNS